MGSLSRRAFIGKASGLTAVGLTLPLLAIGLAVSYAIDPGLLRDHAIGAAAGNIRGMILRDGLTPVAVGMLLGLAASLAVNRVLQSQLVGVSPYDPLTMASAPVVLLAVALVACQIPARRAMNVDPVVALRHD